MTKFKNNMIELTNKDCQLLVGDEWIDIPVNLLAPEDKFRIKGESIVYFATTYATDENNVVTIRIKK